MLLEYCCKTDYRILIAELTDRHNNQINLIERTNKERIQQYIDDERIMKQNMQTMRDHMDQLEKERA